MYNIQPDNRLQSLIKDTRANIIYKYGNYSNTYLMADINGLPDDATLYLGYLDNNDEFVQLYSPFDVNGNYRRTPCTCSSSHIDSPRELLDNYLLHLNSYYFTAGDSSSLSIINDYELLLTTSGSSEPWHELPFTYSNHYGIELCVKKPNGTYIGKDFSLKIGTPEHAFIISFQYYNIHFIEQYNGEELVHEYADAKSVQDYTHISIMRHDNEWTVNYNFGEIVKTVTTIVDGIENKFGFDNFNYSTTGQLYIANFKFYNFAAKNAIPLPANYNADFSNWENFAVGTYNWVLHLPESGTFYEHNYPCTVEIVDFDIFSIINPQIYPTEDINVQLKTYVNTIPLQCDWMTANATYDAETGIVTYPNSDINDLTVGEHAQLITGETNQLLTYTIKNPIEFFTKHNSDNAVYGTDMLNQYIGYTALTGELNIDSYIDIKINGQSMTRINEHADQYHRYESYKLPPGTYNYEVTGSTSTCSGLYTVTGTTHVVTTDCTLTLEDDAHKTFNAPSSPNFQMSDEWQIEFDTDLEATSSWHIGIGSDVNYEITLEYDDSVDENKIFLNFAESGDSWGISIDGTQSYHIILSINTEYDTTNHMMNITFNLSLNGRVYSFPTTISDFGNHTYADGLLNDAVLTEIQDWANGAGVINFQYTGNKDAATMTNPRTLFVTYKWQNTPITNANIQIINLDNNSIAAIGTTNNQGEVNFNVTRGGTYQAQAIDYDNTVLLSSTSCNIEYDAIFTVNPYGATYLPSTAVEIQYDDTENTMYTVGVTSQQMTEEFTSSKYYKFSFDYKPDAYWRCVLYYGFEPNNTDLNQKYGLCIGGDIPSTNWYRVFYCNDNGQEIDVISKISMSPKQWIHIDIIRNDNLVSVYANNILLINEFDMPFDFYNTFGFWKWSHGGTKVYFKNFTIEPLPITNVPYLFKDAGVTGNVNGNYTNLNNADINVITDATGTLMQCTSGYGDKFRRANTLISGDFQIKYTCVSATAVYGSIRFLTTNSGNIFTVEQYAENDIGVSTSSSSSYTLYPIGEAITFPFTITIQRIGTKLAIWYNNVQVANNIVVSSDDGYFAWKLYANDGREQKIKDLEIISL